MTFKRFNNDFDLTKFLVENKVTNNSKELYELNHHVVSRAESLLDLLKDMMDRGEDSPQQVAQYCREEEPELCDPEVFQMALRYNDEYDGSDEMNNLLGTVFNLLHNN